ncbi:MAG TPA: hypothetical protein VFO41_04980 [Alphaproteobacteria bacterium]|nr:hypothetical protein [Alphaproteobacteria bacterium]
MSRVPAATVAAIAFWSGPFQAENALVTIARDNSFAGYFANGDPVERACPKARIDQSSLRAQNSYQVEEMYPTEKSDSFDDPADYFETFTWQGFDLAALMQGIAWTARSVRQP